MGLAADVLLGLTLKAVLAGDDRVVKGEIRKANARDDRQRSDVHPFVVEQSACLFLFDKMFRIDGPITGEPPVLREPGVSNRRACVP